MEQTHGGRASGNLPRVPPVNFQELQSNGQYLEGDQLQPTTTASSVRVRNGKQMVTDGPFAETREQLGGFFMIEANDLAEATNIAGRIPSSRLGSVEIRPVVESAAATPALSRSVLLNHGAD